VKDKQVLWVDQRTTPLTHRDCGGEIHSVEASYHTYEVQSDGKGGFDYTGNSEVADPVDGLDHLFECQVCGKYDTHYAVVIEGTEVVIK
jgi:hypothetical protein